MSGQMELAVVPTVHASVNTDFTQDFDVVRAAYAYDLAKDQERPDAERHNDVRYLWTAKRLDLRLYTLIPSLVQHDNLPSTLGNPQAPAGIPRSSRTYDDKPASEVVGEILARRNLFKIDLDTPTVKR